MCLAKSAPGHHVLVGSVLRNLRVSVITKRCGHATSPRLHNKGRVRSPELRISTA